jgi:demethylmenaquinone methyltransferase/2-methoxy-6-polyprenyl-1,4-benzoquinol methylase
MPPTAAADALVLGRAEALPFAEASFDLVSLGYALRHLAELAPAFRELRRVLRPGGTLVVLELARPEGRLGRALLRLYLGRLVPLLARLATGSGEAGTLMRYYWDTIEACVPPGAILAAMRAGGLSEVRSEVRFGVLRTYLGRRG